MKIRNKSLIWLQTEYKRAASLLPLIVKRAIILAAAIIAAGSMIVFCVSSARNDRATEPKLRIGYVAENSRLTELAVSYIQGMKSIESLCSLEQVTENEGRRLLEEGSLSALIVLPDDVINEILSGSNSPGKLYLPKQREHTGFSEVRGMLFEEIVSAGIGMLGTAQAEIYASSSLLQHLSSIYGEGMITDMGSLLQTMYDDINRFNLGAATRREKMFSIKSLSLTENDTYAVYYGSAVLTIYVMLAGLFAADFFKRSGFWQTMADRRIGVSYVVQLADSLLAGGLLVIVVIMFPFLIFAALHLNSAWSDIISDILTIKVTLAGAVCLILIAAFMTVYHMTIYRLIEKRESAIVAIGIAAFLQAYMTGCLIPTVLLPKAVAGIGKFLPASYIKRGFTLILTGDTEKISSIAAGLAIWGTGLFCVTLILMHIGEREGADEGIRLRQMSEKVQVPPVTVVLFKRLLYRKSIWLCMGLFAILSVTITHIEKESETQITAGVYDETGIYCDIFKDYDGLISFEIYEDSEQVMDAVRKGRVECGYIIPKNITESMMNQDADRSVVVYHDADAVAVPIVNEVVFERIFRQVSLEWYENYILQNDTIKSFGADESELRHTVRECFDRELDAGTTFRLDIERINAETALYGENGESKENRENRAIYPVYPAAAIAVLFCALQGVAQAVNDIRKKHFYKRNRAVMTVLTIALPILAGMFFVTAMIFITVYYTHGK